MGSAHIGGYITGCAVGVLIGKNTTVERWERCLQVFVVAMGGILIAFNTFWSLYQWPPRDIWEEVPWCWARQINIHDGSAVCIRCGDEHCIDTWVNAAQMLKRELSSVSIKACRNEGWFTEDGG